MQWIQFSSYPTFSIMLNVQKKLQAIFIVKCAGGSLFVWQIVTHYHLIVTVIWNKMQFNLCMKHSQHAAPSVLQLNWLYKLKLIIYSRQKCYLSSHVKIKLASERHNFWKTALCRESRKCKASNVNCHEFVHNV